MKYLIIGLGSMGRRRIRCLLNLRIKCSQIYGYDLNKERSNSVEKEYSINVLESLEDINFFDRIIISTSPESHIEYLKLAIKNNKPCFVEASVCHVEALKEISKKITNQIVIPSSTMSYFKAQKKISELMNEQILGNLSYGFYHTGQWLEDWHPWEKIEDFYVSNQETGGCREIVPFELNWLVQIFGKPQIINSLNTKVSNLNAPIDDLYVINLSFERCKIFTLIVEVLSKPSSTRQLRLIGDKGKLDFSKDKIKVETLDNNLEYDVTENKKPENNYINSDQPYILEIKDFLEVCSHNRTNLFPHNLNEDIKLLELLENIEKLNPLIK